MLTPERWRQVENLFQRALERPLSGRALFLDESCGNDIELRREVESLLEAHDQADRFLDDPIVEQMRMNDSAKPESNEIQGHDLTFLPEQIAANRFKITRFIAEGGMGEVYEAWDLVLRERVALKTIRQTIAADEKAENRFLREIQISRKVTHPNVCRVFDVFQHQIELGNSSYQIRFLTMELLPGESLGQKLKRNRRVELSEALELALQIAHGLKAAHDVGVVHRDLKPDNVMLVPSEQGTRAVITDFGLARGMAGVGDFEGAPHLLWALHGIQAEGSTVNKGALRFLADRVLDLVTPRPKGNFTALGKVMGTPAYMSPEQVRGTKVDQRADIWSFGVVLYEMLTGAHPFSKESAVSGFFRRLRGRPPEPRRIGRKVPRQVKQIVSKCLQLRREQRYRDFCKIIVELNRGIGGESAGGAVID